MIPRVAPRRFELVEVCVAHVTYCDREGCNQVCQVCALIPAGAWDSSTDPQCSQFARTLSEYYLINALDEIRDKGGAIHAIHDDPIVKRFF